MSATEELRRLLEERGVKWWPMRNNGYYEDRDTEFVANGKKHTAHEWGDGFAVYNLTPEQAIAATLGSDREAELQKALNKAAGNWAKADAELRKALDFMRIWISEDAHLGESAISCELEKAEGLRNLDAIESAIAATLGGGECEFKPFKGPISDTDEEGERQGVCSVCSAHMHEQFKFCPNCGAKVVD